LREETGLTGQIDRLLGMLTHPSRKYDTDSYDGIIWFRSFTGEPTLPAMTRMRRQWFPLDHLPEIAFESHLTQFIRLYVTAYAHTDPSGS
jgi:8-oxo-dGTP diphosphatase